MFVGLLSVCAIGNFGESLVSNSKGQMFNFKQSAMSS